MIHRKRKRAFPFIKLLPIVLLFISLVILFLLVITRSRDTVKKTIKTPSPVYPTTATYSGTFSRNIVVEYKEGGFVPKTIKIKSGTSITFVNTVSRDMWVASDPHPVHTGLKGFDQMKSLPIGGKYSYLFTKTGNFPYHNHARPQDAGLIIVEK